MQREPPEDSADAHLDSRNPEQPKHFDRSNTTVHGDGDLFGPKHAKHYYPGKLELFEPVSSNDQQHRSHKGARDGDFRRQYDHFGNDVLGDRNCQSYGGACGSHNHDDLSPHKWDCRFCVLGNTRR
jgi:hypothetical protein